MIAFVSNTGVLAFVPSNVSAYAIDASMDALLPIAGKDPRSAAAHPSGRYLYVANTVSNDVTAFAVDATGALGQLATYPAGSVPLALEMDEAGNFLYAANSKNRLERLGVERCRAGTSQSKSV